MYRAAAIATALVGSLTGSLAGCGGGPSIDSIPGERVAKMADHQLEAMHAKLAPGVMSCPRLDFTVDASVRCTRISRLEHGVRVQVMGTVTVTSTRDGGKLHVQMDKNYTKLWVTSAQLEGDLRTRVPKVVGVAPDKVICPQLDVGDGFTSRTTCTVVFGANTLRTEATYSGIGDELPAGSDGKPYRFPSRLFTAELNPGLPSLLREIRRGGVGS